MEEPKLDTNVPTPTSPDPGPAPSKIPLPIPWISTETPRRSAGAESTVPVSLMRAASTAVRTPSPSGPRTSSPRASPSRGPRG
jgi:hypothetical protein